MPQNRSLTEDQNSPIVGRHEQAIIERRQQVELGVHIVDAPIRTVPQLDQIWPGLIHPVRTIRDQPAGRDRRVGIAMPGHQ